MPAETLYDRIGGAAFVDSVIDKFYARVLSDGELRPFFEGVSVEKLMGMQKVFFAMAMDGPTSAETPDLRKAHQDLGITQAQLTRFVNCLIAVIDEESEIGRREAMEIVFRIATYSDEIIGETGGTDG